LKTLTPPSSLVLDQNQLRPRWLYEHVDKISSRAVVVAAIFYIRTRHDAKEPDVCETKKPRAFHA